MVENTVLRKRGLSGIMRAKNEGRFIGASIDSVIDALDELVVVYNDCTDDTEEVLKAKARQYGDKLKIYPYNHKVLYSNLTPEEYEYAASAPDDSPRLHSTQCNYALSKTSYLYAVKIDPDQIYFADEVRIWRDVCRATDIKISPLRKIKGKFFRLWFSLYRRTSARAGHPCTFLIPDRLVNCLYPAYLDYEKYLLRRGQAAVSWSGVNIFVEDDRIFITHDYKNIHPPYNGEGDHLIFKVSPQTRFNRHIYPNDKTKVTEDFNNPYPVYYAGAMWFHLHANRDYCAAKVSEMKRDNPHLFIDPEEFLRLSYKESMKLMPGDIPTLFQRTLFLLVHKTGRSAVRRNLMKLSPLILSIFSANKSRR